MTGSESERDARLEALIAALQHTIRARYPEVTFSSRMAPDGRVFLNVYSNVQNDFAILDLVAEQTVDFMIETRRVVHIFVCAPRD